MKYYSNYEADAVVRVDDNGDRYIKSIRHLRETKVSKDNMIAYGVQGYGVTNFLSEITKEEYDTFGIDWDWDPRSGKLHRFKK